MAMEKVRELEKALVMAMGKVRELEKALDT
jgi:hypothetical protein